MRQENTFVKAYQMDKLAKQLTVSSIQKEWNTVIRESEQLPITPGKKTYGLIYRANKRQYNFTSRDFMDKQFNFYSDGKFYRYVSSIDNSDVDGAYCSEGPLRKIDKPGEDVRGFTIYYVGMMERLESKKI